MGTVTGIIIITVFTVSSSADAVTSTGGNNRFAEANSSIVFAANVCSLRKVDWRSLVEQVLSFGSVYLCMFVPSWTYSIYSLLHWRHVTFLLFLFIFASSKLCENSWMCFNVTKAEVWQETLCLVQSCGAGQHAQSKILRSSSVSNFENWINYRTLRFVYSLYSL